MNSIDERDSKLFFVMGMIKSTDITTIPEPIRKISIKVVGVIGLFKNHIVVLIFPEPRVDCSVHMTWRIKVDEIGQLVHLNSQPIIDFDDG